MHRSLIRRRLQRLRLHHILLLVRCGSVLRWELFLLCGFTCRLLLIHGCWGRWIFRNVRVQFQPAHDTGGEHTRKQATGRNLKGGPAALRVRGVARRKLPRRRLALLLQLVLWLRLLVRVLLCSLLLRLLGVLCLVHWCVVVVGLLHRCLGTLLLRRLLCLVLRLLRLVLWLLRLVHLQRRLVLATLQRRLIPPVWFSVSNLVVNST
mmetsp:Transcript_14002/g.26908  ORF Transcript_14002/g.26908 Transcript_14002/m.26908 type:complete len:207 (-) Transcript_14002:573-1193(-)